MSASSIARIARANERRQHQGQDTTPEAHFVTVTPEIAERWLGKNTHNRNMRPSHVAAMARDMAADKFPFVGDTIRFAVDGTMLDGQNRCAAIVKSGKPIRVLVVTGLPMEAQQYMDQGVPRTTGDQLTLKGEKNGKSLAAILRKAVLYDRGNVSFNSDKVTNREAYDYLTANPEIRWSVDLASSGRRYLPVSASIIGVTHWVCARIDRSEANDFFGRQLINGEGLHTGDPAMSLRKRLSEIASSGAVRELDATGFIFQAWNHWRAGTRVTRLQSPKQVGWTSANIPVPR